MLGVSPCQWTQSNLKSCLRRKRKFLIDLPCFCPKNVWLAEFSELLSLQMLIFTGLIWQMRSANDLISMQCTCRYCMSQLVDHYEVVHLQQMVWDRYLCSKPKWLYFLCFITSSIENLRFECFPWIHDNLYFVLLMRWKCRMIAFCWFIARVGELWRNHQRKVAEIRIFAGLTSNFPWNNLFNNYFCFLFRYVAILLREAFSPVCAWV